MAANDTLKDVTQRQLQGTPGEVLAAFLKLGLTSFGGLIAHLGYFREEFVARRGWIDDRFYADLGRDGPTGCNPARWARRALALPGHAGSAW